MATDFISLEAAINTQERRCLGCPVDRRLCYKCAVTTTTKQLRELPAADVRPVVRAEWERPKGSTPRSWIFVCSKCGDRAYFPVPKYFPKGCGYNFCPNCGADMREVKADEK